MVWTTAFWVVDVYKRQRIYRAVLDAIEQDGQDHRLVDLRSGRPNDLHDDAGQISIGG